MRSRAENIHLTPGEMTSLLAEVARGAISRETAVRLLVAKKCAPARAEQIVADAMKTPPPPSGETGAAG